VEERLEEMVTLGGVWLRSAGAVWCGGEGDLRDWRTAVGSPNGVGVLVRFACGWSGVRFWCCGI
jgi:hypothetical protein